MVVVVSFLDFGCGFASGMLGGAGAFGGSALGRSSPTPFDPKEMEDHYPAVLLMLLWIHAECEEDSRILHRYQVYLVIAKRMPKKLDPFRQYVETVEGHRWQCQFCSKIYSGGATRIRAHLAGMPGYGIKDCEKVDDRVKEEARQTFNGKGSMLANSNQPGCVPQQPSFYWPTGTGTASACPQYQVSLPPGDMPLDNLDTTQQPNLSNHGLDAVRGNEIASSLQQLPMYSPALSSLDPSELPALLELPTHLESGGEQQNARGLSSFPNDQVLGNSMSIRLQEFIGVEVVPVRSNTSPTDTIQHPGRLPQRRDKEDGNDIHQFPSRTQMDIDPSTASQHTSVVGLLVPEASTNTIGPSSSSHASLSPQCQIVPHQSINLKTAHQNPIVSSSLWKNHLVTFHPQALMDMDPCMPSSSQAPNNAPPPPQILSCGTGLIGPSSLPELDMNEGTPMTSHPNTCNNFEENRALKRKLELLYSKEADIRDELKFAASLSLKKPRMEVAKLLANVEKIRNDCTEVEVDVLMREVEDFRRQGKGLFEARETKAYKLLEEKMAGEAFQRNTTEILEYLLGNQLSPLGIYGMGGVGKTTIMVHIHNTLIEKANYGKVLWITVSQDFDPQRLQDTIWKELQDAIGKELRLPILQETDVRKRAAMLCDRLTKEGKSTIILDDVWERFDLKEVGIPIRADGIKLVLTTRSIEVCRQMNCKKMIKIEPLSHIEAESLFLEELGSEVALNLETKAVVKSIVKECAGLPLAVITMARSMRGVTDVFEWKDCLEKLRESDMGQTDMEKEVLMKLKFSYNRLGNHEVQQCFLSCALYPEDEWIDKFELIELFIDQGLIGRLNTREKQYDRGLTILNKLENVCLLEDHGRVMKMHDLIRDMALHVMSTTSLVKARKGLMRIPSEEYWTDALEKVSLMENEIEEFPLNMSPNCPKLSTFLLNASLSCVVIPDSFFKQLWGLKVLNLSGCHNLRELPNSISDLVNLRALLLSRCMELRRIPYLGKLRSLTKLDISLCERVEALEGLDMLVNLRYLDLSRTRIKRLPEGTLGALRNLQYLKVWVVNGEDITKLWKLWKLETLACSFEDVDDFNEFVRVVSNQRNNPRYYDLHVGQEASKIIVKVSHDTRFGNYKRSARIETWSHAIVSAGGESSDICILIPQDVQGLTVSNCNGTTNLSDMGPLENLEELVIERWKNLRVLCGGQDEEIIDIHDSPAPTPASLLFPSLRYLKISGCPKMKYLFGHGPKFILPHLRNILIGNCEEMVGITVAVTSPPLHPSPAFPSLEGISVEWCGKMKRVVESEWLPHLPNLKDISISCCEDMEEIIGDIKVYRCKGMVEMISGAGQGQEESITTPINNAPSSFQSSISLPKLKLLWLRYLPQLKSICEVPITCDSMENLTVYECPELNRIPLQLRLRNIEDLPYIDVEGEEKWKTLIWDHPDAQANLQSRLRFHGNTCVLNGGAIHDCSPNGSESSDDAFEEE
ncbi:hypothetical protein NL676_028931 [Syzygium grande]|nr:hypothetical protein NL676_028931 [Syzygium grande]